MKLVGTVIIAVLGAAMLISAADYELFLDGNRADFNRLGPQTPQNHEFTFVRLIYNGRIPGYLKNWYTDYPKGDRQLISVLGRLTDLDVAPEERGRGVGLAILKALETEAKGLRLTRLVLETGVRQDRAQKLYRQAGFSQIDPYGEDTNSPLSICMAKELCL